jgi:aminoglycoside phosphotransferase (APT) family kinase protein
MTERQDRFSGTKEVQEHLAFDHIKLAAWMETHVPSFSGPMTVKEFKGGQSNPTYQLVTPNNRYVLRRKPPGVLMPSAHAVDREYRVIAALGQTSFPIPKAYALCEDVEVIGTMFYVMEMVDGRIFWDLSLPDQTPLERKNIYRSKLETLAHLQRINPTKIGLDGFGKTENYIARQVHRWSKIYVASETKKIPLMDKLNDWLPQNIPASQELSVIHGDYRLDNMVCHPTEP